MLRTRLVITALLATGCLGRDPLLLPSGSARDEVAAVTGAAPAAVSPGPAAGTLYGAKFEPPRGRILHGMGQFRDGNAGYLELLDDEALQPASKLDFRAIGDWPRNWDVRLQTYRLALLEEERLGRIPQVDLGLYGIDPRSRVQVGVDLDVANTDRYDQRIRELAQVLASHKGPVFLRIGAEFSGEWNGYHPWDYPRAYRKVLDIFRAERADNVAFVWCYEPSAPDDFDARDSRGWKWFPGDDVIDWFGIDLFSPAQFAKARPGRGSGTGTRLARTERFLDMAREHRKPVMIGECSPALEDITDDQSDGRRDWDAWFAPFLQLLDDHPGIEAFSLINTDWRQSAKSAAQGWKRAEIQVNPYIGQTWVEELRKPRYLHLDDVALLDGYAEAAAPRPYKGPGPEDPSDIDPPPGRNGIRR